MLGRTAKLRQRNVFQTANAGNPWGTSLVTWLYHYGHISKAVGASHPPSSEKPCKAGVLTCVRTG